MHTAQRAMRSVVRKPLKNILLFLVILVLSSLLMAALASANASIATQNTSKQAVGAAFRLEMNIADHRARVAAEITEVQLPNGSWMTESPNNQFDSLLLDDIEQIAQVEGIKTYNITTATTAANPVNFKRIEDADRDQSSDSRRGVNLYGNRDMAYDLNVTNGNIVLKEGRWIEPADQYKIAISEQLAELNGLHIGDTLFFNSVRDKQNSAVYEAEIIGIFTIVHTIPSTMSGDTFRSENTIFSDLRFPEKVEGHVDDPIFMYATFEVENTDRYDEVKSAIQSLDIGWQRYDLIDNNGMMEKMSDNFNNMGDISRLLVIIISCASLCILGFVLLLWIRNRNREIGVFMSMGITKGNIIAQFLMEVLIVSLLAFVLSFTVSPMLSGMAADYIAQGQQEQIKQQELEMKNRTIHSGTIDDGSYEMVGVSIHITPSMAASTGVLVILLASGAVVLSGITVMKKNTVHILSDL